MAHHVPTIHETLGEPIMRSLLLVTILSIACMPASACYSVNFKNESNKPISLTWYAYMGYCDSPCGNKLKKRCKDYTCALTALFPGESHTVDFKWGSTIPKLFVAYSPSDETLSTYFEKNWLAAYTYKDKTHGSKKPSKFYKVDPRSAATGTPARCGLKFHLAYTQDDLAEDLAAAKAAAGN